MDRVVGLDDELMSDDMDRDTEDDNSFPPTWQLALYFIAGFVIWAMMGFKWF